MYQIDKSYNLLFKMQNLLYRELSNLIISPISLEMLSFSILHGIGGKCLDEFILCLFGKEVSSGDVTESIHHFKVILNHINTIQNVDFQMNNFIYVSDKFELIPSYIDFVCNNLNTRVKQINFADESLGLYSIIDQDIRTATCGRTGKALKCVPTVSELLLVNCITFQGELKCKPFKMYDGKFQTATEEVDVCYTAQKSNFKFYDKNADFTYVELPYKNESLTLCVILPKESCSLREILGKLNYDTLAQLFKSSVPTEVEVHLPMVRLQSNVDLAYVLQLCGICKVFEEENADFSKMVKNAKGLYMESIVTNLELNLQDLSRISSAIEKVQTKLAPTARTSVLLTRPFLYLVKCDMAKQETRVVFSGVVNVIEA